MGWATPYVSNATSNNMSVTSGRSVLLVDILYYIQLYRVHLGIYSEKECDRHLISTMVYVELAHHSALILVFSL